MPYGNFDVTTFQKGLGDRRFGELNFMEQAWTFILSCNSLSHDRPKASSKVSSPNIAI
jgi:hypothetical protein